MSQYVTAPPETDTVHSGLLYYKHKATFSSGYVLYTGFLLHESTRGAKRIELHSESIRSPLVISLDPPISFALGTAKKSRSVPQHKLVVTVGSTEHTFRLSSEEESAKWAEMLNRVSCGPPLEGHTYEFPVTILGTKHAEGLQLNGCYILKVTDTHVLLYSSNGALPTKFQCPLEDVTKAHSSLDATKQPILIINTSSTSPIGEGGFAFAAQAAGTISSIISHRHNLVEPPLPPRNKSSSPALNRQLTSSHSSDDILQPNMTSRTKRDSGHITGKSGHMMRTQSIDVLATAPLPPPRPQSSLQFNEKVSVVVARHSLSQPPQQLNGLEHLRGTSPSHQSVSHKQLHRSLDYSTPPPVPRSPRPQMNANSVDVTSTSRNESSPVFFQHQPSVGSPSSHRDKDPQDPSLRGSDQIPTPNKKLPIASHRNKDPQDPSLRGSDQIPTPNKKQPIASHHDKGPQDPSLRESDQILTPNKKLSIASHHDKGPQDPSLRESDQIPTPNKRQSINTPRYNDSTSNSPGRQHLYRQDQLPRDDSPFSDGSGQAMAGRFFPSPTSSRSDSCHHGDSWKGVSSETKEQNMACSRDVAVMREQRAMSFRDIEENDFETVDNWIKERSSSSIASLPMPSQSLSPSTTSPHSSSAPCATPTPMDAQEEFYDYSRQGELILCTSQVTTDGYLKLVA